MAKKPLRLLTVALSLFVSACAGTPNGNSIAGQDRQPGVLDNIRQKVTLALEGSLLECAEKGDQPCVERRLAEGTPVDTPNAIGSTALMLASARGNDQLATYLLSKGANADQTNQRGQTPLHFSARSNRGDLITSFVSAGANINATDTAGQTPLMYAAASGAQDAAEALFKRGAKLGIKDSAGKSAADIANSSSHRDLGLLIHAEFDKRKFEKIRQEALKKERLEKEKAEKIAAEAAAKEKREQEKKRKAAGICADPEFDYIKSRCGAMTTDNFRCIMKEKNTYAAKCNKSAAPKQQFSSRAECLQALGTDGAVRCFNEFPEKKTPLKFKNRSECLQALGTDGAVRCFNEFPG